MASIAGTRDGRIFMAALDGNLYELEYNSENSSWWHTLQLGKTRKVNHSASSLSWVVPNWLSWYILFKASTLYFNVTAVNF